MKFLSLWQPYASLVGFGIKREETRHYAIPGAYRGPVVIHATQRWGPAERAKLEELRETWAVVRDKLPGEPTLGAVVAVAMLGGCRLMTPLVVQNVSLLERSCGAWVLGRWAWGFTDVRPIDPPIHMAGAQSFCGMPWGRLRLEDQGRILDAAGTLCRLSPP